MISLLAKRLQLRIPPQTEPVMVQEMRDHLKIDDATEDGILASLIEAARMTCEDFTGRALITRSYSLFLDRWPGEESGGKRLYLLFSPLQSVEEIRLYGEDDTFEIFPATSYFVDAAAVPASLILRLSAPTPQPSRTANGIEIRYVSGYGPTPYDIPAPLKEGIKRLAAHLYEHRGDSISDALRHSSAYALWQNFRVAGLAS